MTEHPENLSLQGQARRGQMLGQLMGRMQRIHRRRRALRSTLVSAAVLLIALAFYRFSGPDDAARIVDAPPPSTRNAIETHPGAAAGSVRVVQIKTDNQVLARLHIEPPPLIERIDDATLLKTLEGFGRPAGLIRFGERVALSAAVTDDELEGSDR